MVTIVVGGHFGDEGKGKIIAYLAEHDKPEIVARAGVGPNAGHTIYKEGRKYGLRMIPCGFVNRDARLLIGAGVLIDPEKFLEEVEITESKDRIRIDGRCAVIEKKHKKKDSSDSFLKGEVGTTGTGCGPANAERVNRKIKLAKDIAELKDYLTDVPKEINTAMDNGEDVLVESTQGFALSLFYGTYPYVTSKDTTAAMACADIGIGPTKVNDVIVVYKAYTTRVGGGPHNTEINERNIEKQPLWQDVLREAKKKGIKGKNIGGILAEYLAEKGTVTGRPRRVGFFNFELARYSSMVNGATGIAISCLDKIFPECAEVGEYDELSERARNYVKDIENCVGVPSLLISTGPKSEDIIDLREG